MCVRHCCIVFREAVVNSSLFSPEYPKEETDPGWSSGLDDFTFGAIVLSSDEESKNSSSPQPTQARSNPHPLHSSRNNIPLLTPPSSSRNPKLAQSPPAARRPLFHERPATHRRQRKAEEEKTFNVKISLGPECKIQ